MKPANMSIKIMDFNTLRYIKKSYSCRNPCLNPYICLSVLPLSLRVVPIKQLGRCLVSGCYVGPSLITVRTRVE